MKPTGTSILLYGELQTPGTIIDREQFATNLIATIEEIRSSYPTDWIAPLARVRGITELAAVLTTPANAFAMGVGLNITIWPQRYRFALVQGELDMGLESGNVALMDGPALGTAFTLLSRAKDQDLPWTIDLGDQLVESCRLFESAAAMHSLITANWSPVRLDIVREFRKSGTQAEVARQLNISQQAVSQALSRAHIRQLLAVEDAIHDWLGCLAAGGSFDQAAE
jgi:lambda repressor-like predicted transcriptional regulator